MSLSIPVHQRLKLPAFRLAQVVARLCIPAGPKSTLHLNPVMILPASRLAKVVARPCILAWPKSTLHLNPNMQERIPRLSVAHFPIGSPLLLLSAAHRRPSHRYHVQLNSFDLFRLTMRPRMMIRLARLAVYVWFLGISACVRGMQHCAKMVWRLREN